MRKCVCVFLFLKESHSYGVDRGKAVKCFSARRCREQSLSVAHSCPVINSGLMLITKYRLIYIGKSSNLVKWRPQTHFPYNSVFQEDISKLRRKIEKAKKPAEKISNGDDILNEEISEYKVGVRELARRVYIRIYHNDTFNKF